MRVLWLTSLRPVGISKSNDYIQNLFLKSVNEVQNADITLSLTQFDEKGVFEYQKKIPLKKNYINISKDRLPKNKKYSNKIMLENALNQFLTEDYDYFVYSTADLIVPANIFLEIKKNKMLQCCFLIFPNILIKNSLLKSTFWPHYGIDLFIFRINKNNAKKLLESIQHWDQYDWGINDNFYVSVCDLLNIPIKNMYKFSSAIKFENNFSDFHEDRNWQRKSWNENKEYFKNFLQKNKLSSLFASGSYYYLIYKIFKLKDLNLKLLLSYIIFYIYFPIRFIIKKFK